MKKINVEYRERKNTKGDIFTTTMDCQTTAEARKYFNEHDNINNEWSIVKIYVDEEYFEVYDESKSTFMTVDKHWMENVNTKQAVKFTFSIFPNGEKLFVDYITGKKVVYNNIHGSWGQPTTIV